MHIRRGLCSFSARSFRLRRPSCHPIPSDTVPKTLKSPWAERKGVGKAHLLSGTIAECYQSRPRCTWSAASSRVTRQSPSFVGRRALSLLSKESLRCEQPTTAGGLGDCNNRQTENKSLFFFHYLKSAVA